MPAPLCFFRFVSADEAEWLRPDGEVQRGSLADLSSQGDGARQILVAPGEAVTLHCLALPSRKRSTWARAVPFALEDYLVEDIETLHFALGGAVDGGYLPVAVVDRTLLSAWLESCEAAGLTPVAVVPDPLLLPWQSDEWSVLLEARRALVRTGRWEGFATERDNLVLLLAQALAEAGEAKPRRLRVWGVPTTELAETGIELSPEDTPSEPLALFASGYQPATVLNLLQGSYSRQAHWGRWLRPWRAAAVLAGMTLLVQIAGQVYDHWRLQREVTALRTEIERTFKDALPEATRIVNPKVQMETRLRELAPSGGSGFLELLYQGARPLANFPNVTLRGLGYRDGQLDLALEGGDPAVLDRLRQQFDRQPGLRMDMRTTQREGQMESKITLKRASS
ncbi:MAG TPA: type II secretion system protein GspL [Candidatus Competibacter sp.]|nr:type II secretion system protein GspL [Candidatus Competibacteraceae bacterium]HPE73422.1 type II secretion system protein GspL [Candidatus Competibacter sp.]HRW65023.1 type II secretion system protein GspL [Candidatus Competibacter sp.]